MTSAIGGHPGTLMMGLLVITLSIGTAPVGFGLAACTHPQDAHVPQATIAMDSSATLLVNDQVTLERGRSDADWSIEAK